MSPERINAMSKLEQLVNDLSSLTVLEASELSKLLEEKWGVSAAAPVAAAAAGGGAAAAAPAEAVEEQTEFTVILTGAGDKKINVIKEVRSVRPDLGLKEAKDLVEGAPQNIKENVSKQEANDIKAKLEAAGAAIQIK
jgi:large subunit ribosomal protein L7/L12